MKSFRERNPVTVGLIGATVMALIGLATFYSERLPIIGGGTTYTAHFGEVAGLKSGDEVRVAGVKVGEVTSVELAGGHSEVTFRANDVYLGDRTTAAIIIKTLLGQKNLALDPLGDERLDPETPIPQDRTTSPYDVNEAFGDLADTTGKIDTDQLAESFRTLSETLGASAPENVRKAFDGVAALSESLAKRDEQLISLFERTNEISKTLGKHTEQFESLLKDGNVLLRELNARADAIGKLFRGTRELGKQLRGLVADNKKSLGPALKQLNRVTTVLRRNQKQLEEGLRRAGPFYRLLGNATGNGRWIDSYICGLVPSGGPPGSCKPPKGAGN